MSENGREYHPLTELLLSELRYLCQKGLFCMWYACYTDEEIADAVEISYTHVQKWAAKRV